MIFIYAEVTWQVAVQQTLRLEERSPCQPEHRVGRHKFYCYGFDSNRKEVSG